MARYRIDITKAKLRCIANGEKIWDIVDKAHTHISAPNMYEADYRLNKMIPNDDGFQYFVEIKTDNKKKDSDNEQSAISDKKSTRQKRTAKVQSPNKRSGNSRSKAAGKKASKS